MKAQRQKKLEFFCAQALDFVLFYEKETHRYVLQWGFCLQSMPISLNDSIICHRESHAKFFSLRVSNYFFVIRAACANCLSFRTWVEHSRDERVKIANTIQLWEFDRKGEKILSITFSESLDFSVVDRLNKRRLVTRRLLWNGTIGILGLKSETKARLYTRRHCMVTSTLRRWNAKTQLFFFIFMVWPTVHSVKPVSETYFSKPVAVNVFFENGLQTRGTWKRHLCGVFLWKENILQTDNNVISLSLAEFSSNKFQNDCWLLRL